MRVVNLGYLFPFGHRAVKIKVTDREFQVASASVVAEVPEVVAFLVTKEYIVVTEPIITYTGDTHEPFSGRGNPLRQVEVKTVTTPPIDFDPSADPGIKVGALGSDTDYVLWVRSDLADVPFSFVSTDLEGRKVDFTASVIWVDLTRTDQSDVDQIISAYDSAGASRNSPSLGGQLVAFADTAGAKPGATAQHVDNYTLTAKYVANGAANFYPLLSSAVVHLPSAEQIVGAGSAPLSPPSVSISDNYLNNGFQTGVTEVYLAVKQNGPSLNFPVNLVGGMAAPNFGVSGIARDLGPVGGDLTNLLAGKFDPSDFFGNLSGTAGKLLGAISIIDIITAVDPDEQAANEQAPQISSNFVYPNNDDTKPPTAIDTKLNWAPTVKADTAGFFQPNTGGMSSNLLITAEIYTPISNPAQTTYSIHGELTNFELVLFGSAASFIGITFNSFTFDSKTGAKTSVQPNIDTVTFLGAAHLHPGPEPAVELARRAVHRRELGGYRRQLHAGPTRHNGRHFLAHEPVVVGGRQHPLRRLAGAGAVLPLHPGQPVPAHDLRLRRRRVLRTGDRCRRDRGDPGVARVRGRHLDQPRRGQRRRVDNGRHLFLPPDGARKAGPADRLPAGRRQPLGARDHPDIHGVLPGVHLPGPGPVLRDSDCFAKYFRAVLLCVGERHDDQDLRRRLRPRFRRRHFPGRLGHLLRSFCLMTAQRIIWTACPNGTAPNGNLRISVAIGPS